MLKIKSVSSGSVGEEIGLRPGENLLGFDGRVPADILDYYYYDAQDAFVMHIKDLNGEIIDFEIEKDSDETLGLTLSGDIKTRTCCNKCVFCFVDQLPNGMRETLYVKDDDWRLSFVSGNYVTLTNLKEGELERIVHQKFSPLYISIHASDAELRKQILGSKKDCAIVDKLHTLAAGGIVVHSQIVVVPELNDGEALKKTILDIAPLTASIAVVPVGVTKFNKKIRPFKRQEAASVIDIVEDLQHKYLAQYAQRKVFAADEFYIKAARALPEPFAYEDFPQIENGVGLIVRFEEEVIAALEQARINGKTPAYKKLSLATGGAAFNHMKGMAQMVSSVLGIEISVYCVQNTFFGESIDVAGLITGGDLVKTLQGKPLGEALLLPRTMLKEFDNVFLDGMKIDEISNCFNVKVAPIEVSGFALVDFLTGDKE